MKRALMLAALLGTLVVATPLVASAEQSTEMIAEKMAIKFARGTANFFTCVGEVPKQIYVTSRDMGPTGYVIGPLKGIGLTFYRGLIGMTEALFFMVPQPGYYDPMIEPAYVWQGWEPKRDTSQLLLEEKK